MESRTSMSVTQAAERLKLTRQRVIQLATSGKIRGEMVGNQWSLRRSSVESYREGKLVKPRKKGTMTFKQKDVPVDAVEAFEAACAANSLKAGEAVGEALSQYAERVNAK